MPKRIFLLLFMLVPLFCHVQYQWDIKAETYLSSESIQYLVDEDEKYSVDKLPYDLFKTYPSKTPNFGFTVGTVWTKIKVRARRKEKIVFEIKNPSMDMVYLYKLVEGKPIFLGRKGDMFAQNEKGDDYLTRHIQFNIEVPCVLIAKIVSRGGDTTFPIAFHTQKQLQRRDFLEQLFLGFYFGIIAFVILITGIVLLFAYTQLAYYIFGFLLMLMLLQLNLFGFGDKYLWPGFINFNSHAPAIFANLGVIYLLLFTSTILNTKKHTPKIHKSIFYINGFILIALLVSLIPNPYVVKYSNIISSSAAVLIPAYCVFIGATILRRKKSLDNIAEFITLGIFLFFFFDIIQILRISGFIDSNFFTEYSLVFGAFLQIIFMTIAVIKNYNFMQKKVVNSFIEIGNINAEHNDKLEQRITERTLEIHEKNDLLEKSKKEIMDSIFYAQFIQNGLLPTEAEFIEDFRDGFVLYKPKDIISGDFYWKKSFIQKKGTKEFKKTTICLGDCTGHGVPGAILSVLGLREINSFRSPILSNPSLTLQSLKKQFQSLFKNEKKGHTIRDGMDASICCFDFENKEVTFSGAGQNLYLVRNNELTVYKGNRMSIDGVLSASIPFTQEKIELRKGDCIYLTTDGYPDQFGGEQGKKLKTRALKEMLVKHHNLPMQQQHELLLSYLETWKGDEDQTDDICLIGIRI